MADLPGHRHAWARFADQGYPAREPARTANGQRDQDQPGTGADATAAYTGDPPAADGQPHGTDPRRHRPAPGGGTGPGYGDVDGWPPPRRDRAGLAGGRRGRVAGGLPNGRLRTQYHQLEAAISPPSSPRDTRTAGGLRATRARRNGWAMRHAARRNALGSRPASLGRSRRTPGTADRYRATADDLLDASSRPAPPGRRRAAPRPGVPRSARPASRATGTGPKSRRHGKRSSGAGIPGSANCATPNYLRTPPGCAASWNAWNARLTGTTWHISAPPGTRQSTPPWTRCPAMLPPPSCPDS